MIRLRWVETLEAVDPMHDAAWVWIVDTEGDVAAAALRLGRATRADLEDAARRRDPERGAAGLVRRRLLRAFAARVLDCAASTVEIERDPNGRCSVREPQRMFASIARYGSWTALALASVPIGVDLDDANPQSPLPLDVLPPRVRAWIGAGPDASRRFAHAWTALEANAKSNGVGVHDGLAAAAAGGLGFEAERLSFAGASLESVIVGRTCAAAVVRHAEAT